MLNNSRGESSPTPFCRIACNLLRESCGFILKRDLVKICLTCIILTVTFLQSSRAVDGQQITLINEHASLLEIFNTIKQDTSFDLVYINEVLMEGKPIAINVTHVPLTDALNICFADQPVTYTI